MREDIYGGLKNAVEKGEPLELAVQTFVNAGYKENEVREAASALSSGIIPASALESKSNAVQKQAKPLPINNQFAVQPVQQKKGFGKGKIILLVVILAILLAALVASIFLKEEITSLISNLLS